MTEEDKTPETIEQPEDNIDPFDLIESERSQSQQQPEPLKDEAEPQETKGKKQETPAKDESDKKDKKSSKKEEAKDDEEEPEENTEISSLKKEVESTKKSLLESQKWGTKNSQKVKYALKKINSLMENVSFTEDEENELNAIREMLQGDMGSPIEEEKEEAEVLHPISKYVSLARDKLEIMQELSDDPESFKKKFKAFEMVILDSTPQEMELLKEELEELKDSPLQLAKKIMNLGEENYNNFVELEKAGGYRKIIESKNKEIKKLNDHIDKIKKKMKEYEDYDPNPKYRVPEDSSNDNEDKKSEEFEDPFDAVEYERTQRHRPRR